MKSVSLLRLLACISEGMERDDGNWNRLAGQVALGKVQATQTLETRRLFVAKKIAGAFWCLVFFRNVFFPGKN